MKKDLLKITGILLLVVSLAACGQGAAPTSIPATEAPEGAVIPTAQATNPCLNEYFPVKENATFNYSSTGGPTGPYSFTRVIKAVQENTFSLNTKFKDQDYIQKWLCKSDGLAPNEMGATDATSILAFDKFTNLTTANVTGFILPRTITPGAEWSYALDIQGTDKVQNGAMTGNVSIIYIAGNKESVTVPAGTFEAIAIEVNTTIDFKVATGTKVKFSADSIYTIWYAPGVGWIKASGHGKLGGQEYVETIVLESYSIP